MRLLVFSLLILLTAPLSALGQNPFPSGPADLEQALRERVSEFYSYFKLGRFRDTEKLVAEESRDAYYAMNKGRILGFEIKSVDFTTEDFREAKVLVSCLTMVPLLGSKPLPMPIQSHWKQLEGEWYMYLKPRNPGDDFPSPMGMMRFSKDATGAPLVNPGQGPTLESLKTMYEVSTLELQFQSGSEQPVTQTIRVANRSPGPLTLERYTRDFAGLEVSFEAEEIPPGEETTISFVYQPEAARLKGHYDVDFMIMPITQRFTVKLTFDQP